jgi:predicted amidohydrolase
VRLAAAAAHFGRDLDQCVARIGTLIEHARRDGVALLVLPHAALGGYLADLRHLDPDALPPSFSSDSPIVGDLARLAAEMTVCFGYTERDGTDLFNAAVCVTGDGILGQARKVHLPPGEAIVYTAGSSFTAFDTPVGRLGMMIDYDKTFPESARTLADQGAQILAVLSAWPASLTRRASSLIHDRQTRLYDLYDAARAAENQVVLVSANQTGSMGGLRFLGSAKIVGPGGEVLARGGAKAGLTIADVDVDAEIARSRTVLHHLQERRPEAYHPTKPADLPISPSDSRSVPR